MRPLFVPLAADLKASLMDFFGLIDNEEAAAKAGEKHQHTAVAHYWSCVFTFSLPRWNTA